MPTCQKISILLPFKDEILTLLCSDDSTQTLLILPVRTEEEHKGVVISSPNLNKILTFDKKPFFIMCFLNISSNTKISQI